MIAYETWTGFMGWTLLFLGGFTMGINIWLYVSHLQGAALDRHVLHNMVWNTVAVSAIGTWNVIHSLVTLPGDRAGVLGVHTVALVAWVLSAVVSILLYSAYKRQGTHSMFEHLSGSQAPSPTSRQHSPESPQGISVSRPDGTVEYAGCSYQGYWDDTHHWVVGGLTRPIQRRDEVRCSVLPAKTTLVFPVYPPIYHRSP